MDHWGPTSFEVHDGDDYAGMEIMPDGSLEITTCSGEWEDSFGYPRQHEAFIMISAERAPEILAGI